MVEETKSDKQNLNQEPNIVNWNNSLEFEQADWFDVLSENKDLKEFKGNRSRAGLVLETLSQGIKETFEEFKKRGILLNPSNIGIDFKNLGPAISYNSTHDLIVITLDFLESLSDTSRSLRDLHEFKRSDGKVAYKGKLLEWVLSMADEEAHHSIFIKAKKKDGENANPLDMTLAEYDAREEEFRALRWVLQSAKRRKFSNVAIEYLEERYRNARNLLEQRRQKNS